MTTLTAALLVSLFAQDDYKLGPDSQRREGVPRGKVTKHSWKSQVFAGTERDYWVYVPAPYDAAKPACLMVFQDGGSYVNETGAFRVPVVFDNLIHRGEMPVTVGLFINPGTFPAQKPGEKARSNRSFEYDTPSDQYARFLLEEMLPEVGKSYALSKNPDDRAICGISSGGICAWTVAWERPDEFRKVLSQVGSFTNIRGGHNYPAYLRKTPRKPIRAFLQDGSQDLDNPHGSWPLANLEMAAALEYSGYDFKFVYGTGRHSGVHGGAILPYSLWWLWRKDDRPRIPLLLITGINNHDWKYTSQKLAEILEKSGPFRVDVTAEPWNTLAHGEALKRKGYKAFVLDYNGRDRWPEAAEKNFLDAVSSGAGVVVVHGSNNGFPGWAEYEKISALCWRQGTGHGKFHAFDVKVTDRDHPVTRDLPDLKAHPDELYHNLVPMHGVEYRVLARAFSSPESGGTGKEEPMIVVLQYGKGRVFHTPLGHVWKGVEETQASLADPQLHLLLARGAEWAATGECTKETGGRRGD